MASDNVHFVVLTQLISVVLIIFLLPVAVWSEPNSSRFFLIGNGKLHIKNTKTGVEVNTSILSLDGSLSDDGLSKIDRVFGFDSHTVKGHISPRTLFMLDYFSDLVAPGKMIHLESGYRSPEYNTNLRNGGGNVARTSTHMDGMALDFYIEGVDGKKLWEFIRSRDCCGIGYYGGRNVHLDSGRPRFWEAATSKVSTGESDFNRRIYLSTDFDRYKAGELVRLSFSSVSNFGFGIRKEVSLLSDSPAEEIIARADIKSSDNSNCLMIGNRNAARSLSFSLPENLREGIYRIKIDFCHRPFEQMPEKSISNNIEVTSRYPVDMSLRTIKE